MTQTPNDQVSAFFDNEIDEAEGELVLRRLTKDRELRDCLSRYAIIGEAVRRNQPLPCDVAERVQAALVGEPALSTPAAAGGAMPSFWRPLVGAAIAATVAVVAIIGLRGLPGTPGAGDVPLATVQQGEPVPATLAVTPVNVVSADSYTVPAVMPVERQSIEARRRLNSYLVSHSQYAKRIGPQNIGAFRAVGFRTGAVPDTTEAKAAEPAQ
ncbi:MAG: sigma-E factor negative regulatory protein [Pseudomonadota bacterium]